MDVSVDRKRIFVDGEFAEGAGGNYRGVLNPATGEVIAEVSECSAGDVDRAVEDFTVIKHVMAKLG